MNGVKRLDGVWLLVKKKLRRRLRSRNANRNKNYNRKMENNKVFSSREGKLCIISSFMPKFAICQWQNTCISGNLNVNISLLTHLLSWVSITILQFKNVCWIQRKAFFFGFSIVSIPSNQN